MRSEQAEEDRLLWSQKAALWNQHIGDDGDRNRRRHVDPVIWRMLGEVDGLDVLDAGCGTGYLSAKLVSKGARVHAIDYAPGMLDQARARFARLALDLEPVEDDCCRLSSVADDSIDRIVSNYVLQDLEDLDGAVRSFSRALRPGGQAVLVFGHPCFATPAGVVRDERGATYTWPFSYFAERRCEEAWRGRDAETEEPIDFPSHFTFYHRPLSTYWRAFQNHGFRVLDFDEPVMQPPYPPELSADEIERSTMCAWSVAFHLKLSPEAARLR